VCHACCPGARPQSQHNAPLPRKSDDHADLIAATTTKTGLTVQCELDANSYAKGIKVTEAEMATLNIESDPWHPEWNYTINPRPPGRSGNS
jgi:hypothetical protein